MEDLLRELYKIDSTEPVDSVIFHPGYREDLYAIWHGILVRRRRELAKIAAANTPEEVERSIAETAAQAAAAEGKPQDRQSDEVCRAKASAIHSLATMLGEAAAKQLAIAAEFSDKMKA